MLGESKKSTNDGGGRKGRIDGEEDVVAVGSACWQLC